MLQNTKNLANIIYHSGVKSSWTTLYANNNPAGATGEAGCVLQGRHHRGRHRTNLGRPSQFLRRQPRGRRRLRRRSRPIVRRSAGLARGRPQHLESTRLNPGKGIAARNLECNKDAGAHVTCPQFSTLTVYHDSVTCTG